MRYSVQTPPPSHPSPMGGRRSPSASPPSFTTPFPPLFQGIRPASTPIKVHVGRSPAPGPASPPKAGVRRACGPPQREETMLCRQAIRVVAGSGGALRPIARIGQALRGWHRNVHLFPFRPALGPCQAF